MIPSVSVSAERSLRIRGMQGKVLDLFGGLSASYERVLDVATVVQDRRWKKWAAKQIDAHPRGLLLDVGCGTLLLEERLKPSTGNVVGLDLTEEMLRGGQKKRLSNVSMLIQGDAESLPFADGTFDTVVTCYVAKYVDLGRFVSELARIAKPGGRVILYDFVRPRGLLRPLLVLYFQVVIRSTGNLLRLTGSGAAKIFLNLPKIIDAATWDSRLLGLTEAERFETRSFKRLTGGVVAAYVGVNNAER